MDSYSYREMDVSSFPFGAAWTTPSHRPDQPAPDEAKELANFAVPECDELRRRTTTSRHDSAVPEALPELAGDWEKNRLFSHFE